MSDLEGVLVVALEQAVAAPFASGRLADAGARVIKIERPEGDFAREYDHLVKGESAYFVWLNRGKQSVRFDLKRAEDLALVEAMVAKADVLFGVWLWRGRAVSRSQGLRSADSRRERPAGDQRRAGAIGAGRHLR